MPTLQQLPERDVLSKAKLARRLGVTDRTVYAWERGEPVKPLVISAHLFGVDARDIDAPRTLPIRCARPRRETVKRAGAPSGCIRVG